MAEVDLDRLARAYRHRSYDPPVGRVAPVLEQASLEPGDVVVDIGGGTGKHAAVVAEASGATTVVADPSVAMLTAAREAGSLVVAARGEALPLCDASARLALFHLSVHHGDWQAMVSEAWRVVEPGGIVWVWTMSPDYARSSHISRWFPRAGEIDAGRFPEPDDIEAFFESLGGRARRAEDRVEVNRPAGEWARAVRDGFVSTLHLLDDEEVEAGLERFRAAHPDPTETITYTLEFVAVWSARPPVES